MRVFKSVIRIVLDDFVIMSSSNYSNNNDMLNHKYVAAVAPERLLYPQNNVHFGVHDFWGRRGINAYITPYGNNKK